MTPGAAPGRRILVHLGLPKTGTTALQGALSRLTPAVAPRVVYPDHGRDDRRAHHLLVENLRRHLDDGGTPEDHAAGVAAALAGDAAFGPGATAAISSEGFANLCGQATAPLLGCWLAALGPAGRVEAVIVVREMTAFLESMYLQSTRFGTVAPGFDAYLDARRGWFRNLCLGLAHLAGQGVEALFAGPGYDVLAEFDARLGVAPGTLAAAAGPSRNVKPGHKAQTVLMHLPEVEARVGFRIDRRAFLKRVSGRQGIPGDTRGYTVFPPGTRLGARAAFRDIAAGAGLAAYAAAFADEPESEAPFVPLDPAALSPGDLDWVAAGRAEFGT